MTYDISSDPHPDQWPQEKMVMTVAGMSAAAPVVRVRVLRAKFWIEGRLAKIDEVLQLPLDDATRLQRAGHVELCKK